MNIPHYFKFGEHITLQNPPNTQTAAGGWNDEWTTFKTDVDAEVIPTAAEEFVIADKLQTVMMYSILVKASVAGITPEMRVLWRDRELYITGIMPEVGKNGVQILTAKERQYAD